MKKRLRCEKLRMSNRQKGILHITFAAFCFALMSFFVKQSGSIPTFEKSFFRNAIAAIVAVITLVRSGGDFRCKKGNFFPLMIRALAGSFGILANFYALDYLSISDANMLQKLSPFFTILFSALILKEKTTKKDWAVLAVAFFGALLVMKPSFSATAYPSLIAAAGGMSAGLAYTFVRCLNLRGERGYIIVLYFSVVSCAICVPFMVKDFVVPTPAQLACLLGAGIAGMGGQLNMTVAYKYAPAKELSVYDYAQVLFAAILGFVFLHELADPLSLLGYAIIIGCGVYRWQGQRRMA